MAKSIQQGFEEFLKRLAPLTSEHEKAKKHKDSVKSSLENNLNCYDLIETGSFGNGTGVRHYSDTDYFGVFKVKDIWNNSSYTLRKVKEALQLTFWQTEGIVVKTPAVLIPFGKYESENLEITPSAFNGIVQTHIGKKASYSIPNYDGSWMNSSPDAHNAYVKREDIRLGYKLKPLIKLVKAWKFFNNAQINSFYIELRVTKFLENQKSINYDIDIVRIIKHLYDIKLANIIDPMGISGYVQACSSDPKKVDALSKLTTGLIRCIKAHEQREKDIEKCFYWWNMFYNNKFPVS
jgi:hypothetical protein